MNKLLRKSQMFVKRNAPTILTCVGGVGVVATAVMAVKATPKALELLEEAKEEKGDDLTKLEVVKVACPVYIPSIITGTATLACIFGANVLNKRSQASIISAYALLDQSYKDYKNKVGELYGDEADKQVKQEIVKDKYEEEEFEYHNDKQLFYDDFSGRYFEATLADVLHAEYELNRILAVDGGVYLNEFYELLGIPRVDYGDYLGWSSFMLVETCWYSWVDFDHQKVVMDDGLECYIITMGFEPSFGFEEW